MSVLRIILTIMLSVFPFYAMQGQEVQEKSRYRFTCGAEWGYVMTLQSGYHHNYFSTEGFRVDIRDNHFLFYNNADVYVHTGYDMNDKWNLSVYIGYAGVHDIHSVVPVSIRGTRYFKADEMGDRWFAYADLGSGICIKREPQEILVGKLGGGYGFALNRRTVLELIFNARITYTHPLVIDQGDVIMLDKTNRNNAYVSALSIGLGLKFK